MRGHYNPRFLLRLSDGDGISAGFHQDAATALCHVVGSDSVGTAPLCEYRVWGLLECSLGKAGKVGSQAPFLVLGESTVLVPLWGRKCQCLGVVCGEFAWTIAAQSFCLSVCSHALRRSRPKCLPFPALTHNSLLTVPGNGTCSLWP